MMVRGVMLTRFTAMGMRLAEAMSESGIEADQTAVVAVYCIKEGDETGIQSEAGVARSWNLPNGGILSRII